MSSEFNAAIELLQMLVVSPRTGVLMLLLVIAALVDIRTGRIPNWLVFGGALYALAYNAFFPLYPRDIGILFALGGLAVGLVAFLPLYLFRVMGAGDVKLMAMVGAFIGASACIQAVLASLLAGGLLAVAFALCSGRLHRMVHNVVMMFRGTVLTFATGVGGLTVQGGTSAGKMPYGVAIAAGTIGYLVAAQLGLVGNVWA
jgi:prepilin peptidase CpaA